MNKWKDPVRSLALGAMIILLIGSLCSILLVDSSISKSIIPYPEIIIPCVNFITFFFAVFLFFYPQLDFLKYIILLPQLIVTTITGHETLGVFLFVLFLIVLSFESRLSEKCKKTIIKFSVFFWSIILFGIIPYSWINFFMALAETVFFMIVFYSVNILFERKLKSVMPIINSKLYFSREINLPAIGETIYLKDYGLSEREAMFVILHVMNDLSYGQIANKMGTSLSIVKREMSNCLAIFGCRSSSTLKLVFSQYNLVY